MTTKDYQNIAHTLPTDPGVYKFISPSGVVLYVGKAKNLKNRLSSYFGERKDRHPKTTALVKHAHHFDFTIVNSEQDALLLESTLIKQHQPRYNVMLKDGKTYPYICIKQERFPRVFMTRRVIKDGSTYFGPYTSGRNVYVMLDLIKQLFPLRTCALALTRENVERNKFKVCLEYHIKNCAGPCAGHESEADYMNKIAQIKNMLRGSFGEVKSFLRAEMQRYAEDLSFEKAQEVKDKLRAFEDYQGKSTVVSTTITDVEVYDIATDDDYAFVSFLKVVDGAIIHTFTLAMTKNHDDDARDLLEFGIQLLQERFNTSSPEIIVGQEITHVDINTRLTIPKIGDKKKLLDLATQNAKFMLLQRQKQDASKTAKQTPAERILRTLQSDLQMDDLPMHIECFDNSNLQGTNPVSSCVVFKNAKPSKRDYRHFNVKTVEGPNDFATMEEVVTRRYKRLLAESQPLPQLIIIDGGKGQLSAAMTSIRALGIADRVTVIGIAKQLEEIFFPDDPVPLYIDKKSESLKLIQQARNEAHRFGITFHRDQRSRNFLGTELTAIPGIGEKTAEKLLQSFGSVKKLRAATPDAIAEVAGKAIANKLTAYFSGSGEVHE